MASVTPDYWPFYCEENVWRLAGRLLRRQQEADEGGRIDVLLITNPMKQVAVFGQRARPAPGEPVVWDYHVVLLETRDDGAVMAWDLDSTVGAPVALQRWIDASFRPVGPSFAPRFRVIDGATYRDELRSKREHMIDPGGTGWRAPPPPWDPPGHDTDDDSNLTRWLDLDAPNAPGEVLDLAGLIGRFG